MAQVWLARLGAASSEETCGPGPAGSGGDPLNTSKVLAIWVACELGAGNNCRWGVIALQGVSWSCGGRRHAP